MDKLYRTLAFMRQLARIINDEHAILAIENKLRLSKNSLLSDRVKTEIKLLAEYLLNLDNIGKTRCALARLQYGNNIDNQKMGVIFSGNPQTPGVFNLTEKIKEQEQRLKRKYPVAG